MAPKEPCAKYQYVVTSSGPKIVPVQDNVSKEEESAADYNTGGYLPVKINDVFRDGRYLVLRKLGYNPFSPCRPCLTLPTAGATSPPSGSFMIPSASHVILLSSLFHPLQPIPLLCPQGRQVRFPLCRHSPRRDKASHQSVRRKSCPSRSCIHRLFSRLFHAPWARKPHMHRIRTPWREPLDSHSAQQEKGCPATPRQANHQAGPSWSPVPP